MKVTIARQGGRGGISIDGVFYPPLSFKSFRANERNISEFYEAGVRLFSVLSSGITSAIGVPYSRFGESWIGPRTYDFSAIDRQMDLFLREAPEGYFAPMFQVDTREWYLKMRPDLPNSFTCLSQAIGDAEFCELSRAYIRAAVEHCEEKYGDRIYGYFLLGGQTTEWMSGWDGEEPNAIKDECYFGKTGRHLPTKAEMDAPGSAFLSPSEDEVAEARRFSAELIADGVLDYVGAVREVIGHEKLVGLYYGYLLELGGTRLFESGHLGFEKIFLSDEVDLICSPSSYAYRDLSDPSAYMVTAKTLDLHRKLYFLEFDHITHVAPTMIYEPDAGEESENAKIRFIPGAENKCRDEWHSLNLMYRDFLLTEGSGAALWWFDMFDGWFRGDVMMGAVKNMIEIDRRLHKDAPALADLSVAEVAVVSGGEALYRVRKTAGLASTLISDLRRTLAEAGAPYDWYAARDLKAVEERGYRFVIFHDAFTLTEEDRATIARLRGKGVTLLWLYAPDYATEGQNDARRVEKLVGLHVTEGDKPHGDLLWNGERVPSGLAVPPFFSISDGEPLCSFEDECVGAARGERDILITAARVPSGLLRTLYRAAGVRVYSDNPRVYTYPSALAIGVYNATDGEATVTVPENRPYVDLIGGKTYEPVLGKVTLPARKLRAFLLK